MEIKTWIKKQIAAHPMPVLAFALIATALVSWVELPDPQARDMYGRTPLVTAAYEGDMWAARLWLTLGADVDAPEACGMTPLMRAIQHGHVEMAKWLLHRGADPTARDETGLSALHLAARKGERELVERLLDGGADPTAEESVYGRTPIKEAEEAGHDELVDSLRAQLP